LAVESAFLLGGVALSDWPFFGHDDEGKSGSIKQAQFAVGFPQTMAEAQVEIFEQFDFDRGVEDAELFKLFQRQDVAYRVVVGNNHSRAGGAVNQGHFPKNHRGREGGKASPCAADLGKKDAHGAARQKKHFPRFVPDVDDGFARLETDALEKRGEMFQFRRREIFAQLVFHDAGTMPLGTGGQEVFQQAILAPFQGKVVVIDSWGFDAPSTKSAAAAIATLGLTGSVLVVHGRDDLNTIKSFRNLAVVQLIEVGELNAYDVLCNETIVFTTDNLPTGTPIEKATGQRKTFAKSSGATADGPNGPGSHAPLDDGSAPEGFDIKGNAQSNLYHVPGSRYYKATIAEVWFSTEDAAEAAGYSKPGAKADDAADDAKEES
jgi:hypothetical protein